MSIKKQAVGGCNHPKSIGLLGGTFDPPHIGHLIVASQVKFALGLDEVWLVVANDPWQKEGSRPITAATERLELVRAALAGQPPESGLVASDIELRVGGPSYTFNTLKVAQKEVPGARFTVVIGADVASDLDTWHRGDELRAHAHFAIVHRAGHETTEAFEGNVEMVKIPPMEISSTELRELVRLGKPLDFLTPMPVIQHIQALGLYSGEL